MYKVHCSWYYIGFVNSFKLIKLIIKDIPNETTIKMPAESANNIFFNISMSIEAVTSTTWQTEERL